MRSVKSGAWRARLGEGSSEVEREREVIVALAGKDKGGATEDSKGEAFRLLPALGFGGIARGGWEEKVWTRLAEAGQSRRVCGEGVAKRWVVAAVILALEYSNSSRLMRTTDREEETKTRSYFYVAP